MRVLLSSVVVTGLSSLMVGGIVSPSSATGPTYLDVVTSSKAAITAAGGLNVACVNEYGPDTKGSKSGARVNGTGDQLITNDLLTPYTSYGESVVTANRVYSKIGTDALSQAVVKKLATKTKTSPAKYIHMPYDMEAGVLNEVFSLKADGQPKGVLTTPAENTYVITETGAFTKSVYTYTTNGTTVTGLTSTYKYDTEEVIKTDSCTFTYTPVATVDVSAAQAYALFAKYDLNPDGKSIKYGVKQIKSYVNGSGAPEEAMAKFKFLKGSTGLTHKKQWKYSKVKNRKTVALIWKNKGTGVRIAWKIETKAYNKKAYKKGKVTYTIGKTSYTA